MARKPRTIDPEIARVLQRIKIAIQSLGYSMRDIEKRLRVSDGYLSRVFLGTIELKLEHILGIAKALGMAPEELMAFVYPKQREPMSPAAYELWRRVGGAPLGGMPGLQAKSSASPSDEDLDRALRRSLGRVLVDLAGTLGGSGSGGGSSFP
jgi:transcriptional regulator with XRE-family HTH domain